VKALETKSFKIMMTATQEPLIPWLNEGTRIQVAKYFLFDVNDSKNLKNNKK